MFETFLIADAIRRVNPRVRPDREGQPFLDVLLLPPIQSTAMPSIRCDQDQSADESCEERELDHAPRWRDLIGTGRRAASDQAVIGVLPGEGVGPEVIGAAIEVLSAVEEVAGGSVELRYGGLIGQEAEVRHGAALTPEVLAFCRDVFGESGAILNGPGGGRFVYDLRRQLGLYCKISPLRAYSELQRVCKIRVGAGERVDILIVRENLGGIYQGTWSLDGAPGERRARHEFEYAEADVLRILETAAKLAAHRRGRMEVVVKTDGIPTVSRLWHDGAESVAAAHGVLCSIVDVDYACYRLLQHATELDVIVAPNLFGDVLSDLGATLMGSRALSFGASFSERGEAVYQTNHGAARDLAGSGRANPIGQILALAALLRESLGMGVAACRIEQAVRRVWRNGWRTQDLREPGCRIAGTREMGRLIAENLHCV